MSENQLEELPQEEPSGQSMPTLEGLIDQIYDSIPRELRELYIISSPYNGRREAITTLRDRIKKAIRHEVTELLRHEVENSLGDVVAKLLSSPAPTAYPDPPGFDNSALRFQTDPRGGAWNV